MNLFILSLIQREIAEYMMDKHVSKILLEAVQMASSRVPNSIQIVTMIERVNGKHMSDHVGFTIETDQWLVGYGLDNNQLDRTLEDIYTIN